MQVLVQAQTIATRCYCIYMFYIHVYSCGCKVAGKV